MSVRWQPGDSGYPWQELPEEEQFDGYQLNELVYLASLIREEAIRVLGKDNFEEEAAKRTTVPVFTSQRGKMAVELREHFIPLLDKQLYDYGTNSKLFKYINYSREYIEYYNCDISMVIKDLKETSVVVLCIAREYIDAKGDPNKTEEQNFSDVVPGGICAITNEFLSIDNVLRYLNGEIFRSPGE